MLFKKHQSLKYIFNRLRQKLYEKRNPDAPWMTPKAIELLDQLITSDDIGVEYGSGRSTRWFARRCKHLTSFENNKKWFEIVSKQITSFTNVSYEFHDLNKDPMESSYCRSIKQFPDESLDFIVIDGKCRELIASNSVTKLKRGGLLIFDNAERYLPNDFDIPESIGNDGALIHDRIKILMESTGMWRRIWTTNGVTATLLMFKS